jgi:hypothetical protein
MEFETWLESNFTQLFKGSYEVNDKPELGSWSKEELEIKFNIANEAN